MTDPPADKIRTLAKQWTRAAVNARYRSEFYAEQMLRLAVNDALDLAREIERRECHMQELKRRWYRA